MVKRIFTVLGLLTVLGCQRDAPKIGPAPRARPSSGIITVNGEGGTHYRVKAGSQFEVRGSFKLDDPTKAMPGIVVEVMKVGSKGAVTMASHTASLEKKDDSVEYNATLDAPKKPGDYTIVAKNGRYKEVITVASAALTVEPND